MITVELTEEQLDHLIFFAETGYYNYMEPADEEITGVTLQILRDALQKGCAKND